MSRARKRSSPRRSRRGRQRLVLSLLVSAAALLEGVSLGAAGSDHPTTDVTIGQVCHIKAKVKLTGKCNDPGCSSKKIEIDSPPNRALLRFTLVAGSMEQEVLAFSDAVFVSPVTGIIRNPHVTDPFLTPEDQDALFAKYDGECNKPEITSGELTDFKCDD